MSINTLVPLRRSPDQAVVAGVLAGFARKTGWDLTVLRVAFVALTVLTAFHGAIVYGLFWLFMPIRQPGDL
jgi:phage shock protein C